MVAHTCNSHTQEVEAAGPTRIYDESTIYHETLSQQNKSKGAFTYTMAFISHRVIIDSKQPSLDKSKGDQSEAK